jgi:serine phosphatase RsbU (regulator of sigma subunit)
VCRSVRTFATDRVVVSGILEPAYAIGGDSFDYAVNGSSAHVLVLDSVGHGLPAALLASAAIGAHRHARRELHDLPDIAVAVNQVIAENFSGSQFATAAIARLDLDTGLRRWVNAGHPDPLVLREGASGDAAPEALRRLMRKVLEHQGGMLQDDASIVVLEWLTGTPQRLVP